MTHTTTAKETLKANWNELIATGDMTAEEMAESLQNQISGWEDLSADELTPQMAEILGWDIEDITDEQTEEWREIVNETAKEWLVGETLKARGWDEIAIAEFIAYLHEDGIHWTNWTEKTIQARAEDTEDR